MVLQQEGSKVASRVAVPQGVATLQEGVQQGAQLPEDKREVEQTQAEVVLRMLLPLSSSARSLITLRVGASGWEKHRRYKTRRHHSFGVKPRLLVSLLTVCLPKWSRTTRSSIGLLLGSALGLLRSRSSIVRESARVICAVSFREQAAGLFCRRHACAARLLCDHLSDILLQNLVVIIIFFFFFFTRFANLFHCDFFSRDVLLPGGFY